MRGRTGRSSQEDRVVNSRVRRIASLAMAVATVAFGVGILLCTIGTAGMGIVGAVLSAKAPRNPLGPAYQVAAMFMALTLLASLYGERGVSDLPGLPFVPIAGWLMQLAFVPAFAATFTVFLLFPDGHPPSVRWRPVAWLIWGGAALAAIGTTFGPSTFEFDTGSVANPFRMGPQQLLVGFNTLGGAVRFAGGILAVISVVVRFRRSEGEERQQLRWLAWAAALILVCVVVLVSAWSYWSSADSPLPAVRRSTSRSSRSRPRSSWGSPSRPRSRSCGTGSTTSTSSSRRPRSTRSWRSP
jgi:hypothetical protein